MGKEVERLEHHAHVASYRVDVADVVGQLYTVNYDVAALVVFKPVDGADERGLA